MTAPPRTLAGRYRLVQRLGAGGMGVVWRARDDLLGRDVAVKELLLPGHLSAEQRDQAAQRALREARAAALLQHTSIVTVHDVVVDEGRPCIVMDLLPGRSLDAVLDDDGPLPPDRVARIGLEILDALRAAHAHGILHRDVKPANIFLREDGRAVLTDFGIAALDGEATLTREGSLIGSPAYMAPERVRHDHSGPASDLWSLGATLYALTESRPPFARGTVMGTLGAVLADEPDPPRAAGPLGPLLARLLVKDPAARLSTEAAEAYLRALVTGERTVPALEALPPSPHPAHAGPPTAPARPPRSGAAWIVAALAVVVATVVVIVTVVVIALRDPGDTADPAPPPQASRSAPPSSGAPEPARFAAAPSPCGLISAEQAGRLVRTFHNHGDETPDSATGQPSKYCVWQTSATADGDERLRLTLRTTAGTAAARRLLAEERAGATERVTPLPDLGEAAFTTPGPDGDSVIHFRVGNLVAEIRYRTGRDRRDELARQAARWARSSLERS
ncbi:serine/threonine-protein kinase [Actinomadura sp. 7K507]|uniref:serine/threonine-protein kinase n=1 Tax=Actinomadura sp. 7K507 TaxID=2530365 RepID=UPI0010477484|nr:serine/threonine-protein kinase [Actinomadura sp. 7K507]TDC78668.1 serine/threonine protein kinase [Actinomadura sp. 7K507]